MNQENPNIWIAIIPDKMIIKVDKKTEKFQIRVKSFSFVNF